MNFDLSALKSQKLKRSDHLEENIDPISKRRHFDQNKYSVIPSTQYQKCNTQIQGAQQEKQAVLKKFLSFFTQWDQDKLVPSWEHNFETQYSRKKFKLPFNNNNLEIDGYNYLGQIELLSESTFRHYKTNIRWEHDFQNHISYEVFDLAVQDNKKEIIIRQNDKDTGKFLKHHEFYNYEPISPVEFLQTGQASIQTKINKWFIPEIQGQENKPYPSKQITIIWLIIISDKQQIQNIQLQGTHKDFVHDFENQCSYQIADFQYTQEGNTQLKFENIQVPIRYDHFYELRNWIDEDEKLQSVPIYDVYIKGQGFFKSPNQKIYIQREIEGKPQNYIKKRDYKLYVFYARPGRQETDINYGFGKYF